MYQDDQSRNRYVTLLAILGSLLLLIGTRWWLIHHYGSPVPFWDQWDGEAASVYGPYLKGELDWVKLLASHNEHRILTTRLFALGLFIANGEWNPLLQMLLNAVIIAGVLMFLLSWLNQALSLGQRWALLAFCLVLFSVPYAWENTLVGFQTQYYFNLLFSFVALWLLVGSPALSPPWWAGLAAAILAWLSLASGLFALVAAVPVIGAQCIWGSDERKRGIAAIAILMMLFLAGYALTPHVAQSEELKAHSIPEFVYALKGALSWPGNRQAVAALLLQVPSIVFLFLQWRDRRQVIPAARWFIVALIVWMWGQDVSLAYGRAVAVRSSRYLDLYAIGLLVNFACLLWSTAQWRAGRFFTRTAICAAWPLYVAFALYGQRYLISEDLDAKRAQSAAQLANVCGYLETGDKGYLFGKALLDIPYPRPSRLQELLDDPVIRRSLPAALMPSSGADHAPGRFDAAVSALLAHATLLMILGGVAIIGAGVIRLREVSVPAASQQLGNKV